MFSKLGGRLGGPGLVIAVLALVLSVGGAAWAANKYVITSTSQIKPSVLKKLKGTKGPRGPVGPAGATGLTGPTGAKGEKGDKGDKGDPGTAGDNGQNGQSVTASSATVGECPAGGTKFTVGAASNTICNGEEGSPWAAGGVLPPTQTETGMWGSDAKESEIVLMPISFNIPIDPAPEPIYVEFGETSAPGCPGVVNGMPTADPGKLCLYVNLSSGGEELRSFLGTGPSGTVLRFKCISPSCFHYGTWAASAAE